MASAVVSMAVRRGILLVAIGGILGAVLAAAGAKVLSGALFVGIFDPASLAFTVLLTVAALANWIPARRASRMDPIVALRHG